jgi:hypothetical protein
VLVAPAHATRMRGRSSAEHVRGFTRDLFDLSPCDPAFGGVTHTHIGRA